MKVSIFTDAELQAMAARIHGDYSDPTGIYASRVRPKLKEIQAWNTPEMRARIKKLQEYRRRVPDPEPATPMQEQSFQQFATDIGY